MAMRSGPESAKNLFFRLTSLTVAEGSKRIENFCTETLAWCLLISPVFQKRFLSRLLKVADSKLDNFVFDTQIHCKSEINKHRYFDLVVRPKDGIDKLYVIEVKVHSKFWRENFQDHTKHQLQAYREAAQKTFLKPLRPVIVALTVDEKPEEADITIHWSDLEDLIRRVDVSLDIKIIFKHFADFLKMKNMGKLNVDLLKPNSIIQWHKANSLQAQFQRIFGKLQADRKLKTLIGRRPLIEASDRPESGLSWFGFHAKSCWVGVGFYPKAEKVSDRALLWAELYNCTGDKFEAMEKMPDGELKRSFENARNSDFPGFPKINHKDASPASLVLIQPLDSKFNGEAEQILEWFRNALVSLEKIRSNSRKPQTSRKRTTLQ